MPKLTIEKSTGINQETEKRSLRLFFTGLTMGLADLIPGVSGGTIALLFGIYEKLLGAVKLMTGLVLKLILTGKFKEAYQITPFKFLLPLFSGILLAIFGLAKLVSYLLETQAVLVWSLFFGLVVASAFVVLRRVTKWNFRRVVLALSGFALTFIIVGLPSAGGSDSLIAIFATGAITITAMILPGISGSLIMVLLGQYKIMIDAAANRDFFVLAIFAAGAILGLALFARLFAWLLRHYHIAMIAFLAGVIAGSLRRIWPWQNIDAVGNVANILPSLNPSLALALLLALTGFILVILLERAGIAKEDEEKL